MFHSLETYPVLLVALLVLSLPTGALASVTLATRGHSQYQIVIAPDASPTVKRVAQELSDDFAQISGAALPVITSAPKGPAFFVGPGPDLPDAFRAIALSARPDESIVVRTHGRDLYLAGHGDRGTMYAVYAFLEDQLGARWYAPDATVLPKKSRVSIPDLDVQQSPAFEYRDTDEYAVFRSGPWDAHLRLNGTSVPAQPDLGGMNRLFNGAENFYELVPPARYFADHPEYFSLINGKRTASGGSQLCLTNPDVMRIVTAALLQEAQKNPGELVLGLSPNDAFNGACQCDNCKASDARYGAPSGTLLNFVNQVAASVQAALPGRKIWVETLAYQYAEKAPNPGAIAPAENVLVCLAPIFACEAHPLATDPENARSRESLLAWNKIAPGHLQVWHYVTNFAHYLQPFPDWDELGADMAYYRDHGVSGMFCEGNYQSGGEMSLMRTWVMAHLFWNPDQDVWALVKDYCDGYYGPAGPSVYQYLRLMRDAVNKPGVHMHIYDPPTAAYLSPDTLQAADKLLDSAEAAAGSPEILGRVQEVRLGIRYVELMRSRPAAGASADVRAAYRDRLAGFIADIHRFKIIRLSEGQDMAAWIAEMEK